jgi:hypothetical protein
MDNSSLLLLLKIAKIKEIKMEINNKFTFTLDTIQQMEFMDTILTTAIYILLRKNDDVVASDMPIGWQDIFASSEKEQAMTNLLNSLSERIALHQNNKTKQFEYPTMKLDKDNRRVKVL